MEWEWGKVERYGADEWKGGQLGGRRRRRREAGKIPNAFVTKVYDCDNVVSNGREWLEGGWGGGSFR